MHFTTTGTGRRDSSTIKKTATKKSYTILLTTSEFSKNIRLGFQNKKCESIARSNQRNTYRLTGPKPTLVSLQTQTFILTSDT